jgi:sugar phosphate isomerase/epimerase
MATRQLGLCLGTLLTATLPELAAAAAGAGFGAISISPHLLDGARAAGRSDADVRALLADHGLAVTEVDPLLTWLPGLEPAHLGDEPPLVWFGYSPDDFFRAAEAVGATRVNVAQASEVDGPAVIVDALGALGRRAAEHGLEICYEFLPWSATPTLASACDAVAAVGLANVGVMLDVWHLFRGGGRPEDVTPERIDRVIALQLSDAPLAAAADPIAESIEARLMPGEGAIPLTDVLARLLARRPDLVPTVEVFNAGHAAQPHDAVAARAATTTRAVLPPG